MLNSKQKNSPPSFNTLKDSFSVFFISVTFLKQKEIIYLSKKLLAKGSSSQFIFIHLILLLLALNFFLPASIIDKLRSPKNILADLFKDEIFNPISPVPDPTSIIF